MVITLKRFSRDEVDDKGATLASPTSSKVGPTSSSSKVGPGELNKLDHMVDYSEYFSWGSDLIYRLRAVVNHVGPSLHAGHYTAEIRAADGLWRTISDDAKIPNPRGFKVSKNAYILIYELLSPKEEAFLKEQNKLGNIVNMKLEESNDNDNEVIDEVGMRFEESNDNEVIDEGELDGIVDMRNDNEVIDEGELDGIVGMKL
jgi:hypothetical protein